MSEEDIKKIVKRYRMLSTLWLSLFLVVAVLAGQ